MIPLGLIYLLFFLSGACGLIYEVLWLRLLEKVTGSSPVAISILLGIFMAGLGAGSILGGKVAHGINPKERLFFIYGGLEGAIGIWALLIPIFTTLLGPLLSFFYNIAQSGSGIYYLGCLLVGLLILFVPTCLMGFTLPVLIQYAEASSHKVGLRSGLLYGFNTAGGAVGALFAGFVGIPLMGTNMTLLVAISISLSIFVTSYLLYRFLSLRRLRSPVRESKIDSKFPNYLDIKTKVLGLIFLVSGVVSISFEIIWTNLLALLIGPTIYSFSIVVSTYIIGIGFGSLLFSKFFKKNQGIELIILMQFIMALSFLLISQVMGNSQLFFSKLIFTFKDDLILLWLLKGCLLFVLMLPPTIISGGMFPLILNVLSPKNEEAGGKAGFIYGLNTIGCIIGSILTGFLLMPYLGKIYSIKLLVSVQVFAVACFGIYLARSQGMGFWGYRRSYLFGGIILVLSYILPQWDVSLLSYGRYHNFSGITSLIHRFGWVESFFRGNSALRSYEKAREILFQGDGLNGFTVVERYYDSAGKEKLSLITSGKPDASSHGDRATQTMLAHVPLLFHPDPKDVMVLGLASGMTAGEVLLYPVRSLDVVEINPQVLKASELFLSYNNNLLKDPRVRIVLQDGRVHLTHTKRRYDVIISEPSNPWMSGLANLFSYQFFLKGKGRLKEGGIFLQWIHGYQMDWDTFSLVCRTFFSVFPKGLLLKSSPSGDDYLLLGLKGEGEFQVRDILKNISYAQRSQMVKISHPSVLGNLILVEGPQGLLGKGPIHTDERPILEFQAPKLLYAKSNVEENLLGYLRAGALKDQLLNNNRYSQNLSLYEFSLSVFQPMFSLLKMSYLGEEGYTKARDMTLSYCKDNLVGELDGIEEREVGERCAISQRDLISKHLTRFPEDWLAMIDLGNVLYFLGDKSGARAQYEKAMELNRYDPAPIKALGIMALKELNWSEALRYFEEALSLDPYDPIIYFNLGLIHYQRGLFARAVEFLRKGLEIQEDPRARALLSQLEGK